VDRINEVTKDVLQGIIQIRQMDAAARPQPEVLHQRMRVFIERAMRKATDLGYSSQDAQDIGYALVAFADEVAISRTGEVRDYWLPRTLQLSFFNEANAGEGFFQRLSTLVGDTARNDVLRVYYECLALGFQGKYRVRGGEVELAAVTDRVTAALRADAISPKLSPQGARPRDTGGGVRGALPLIAASIGAVVLSLLLYAGLRLHLSSSAADLAARITAVIGG
jgi:type VI secretion system protein ImpK